MRLKVVGVLVAGGVLLLVSAVGYFARGATGSAASQGGAAGTPVASTAAPGGTPPGSVSGNGGGSSPGPSGAVGRAASPGLTPLPSPSQPKMVNIGLNRSGHHERDDLGERHEGREGSDGGEGGD